METKDFKGLVKEFKMKNRMADKSVRINTERVERKLEKIMEKFYQYDKAKVIGPFLETCMVPLIKDAYDAKKKPGKSLYLLTLILSSKESEIKNELDEFYKTRISSIQYGIKELFEKGILNDKNKKTEEYESFVNALANWNRLKELILLKLSLLNYYFDFGLDYKLYKDLNEIGSFQALTDDLKGKSFWKLMYEYCQEGIGYIKEKIFPEEPSEFLKGALLGQGAYLGGGLLLIAILYFGGKKIEGFSEKNGVLEMLKKINEFNSTLETANRKIMELFYNEISYKLQNEIFDPYAYISGNCLRNGVIIASGAVLNKEAVTKPKSNDELIKEIGSLLSKVSFDNSFIFESIKQIIEKDVDTSWVDFTYREDEKTYSPIADSMLLSKKDSSEFVQISKMC